MLTLIPTSWPWLPILALNPLTLAVCADINSMTFVPYHDLDSLAWPWTHWPWLFCADLNSMILVPNHDLDYLWWPWLQTMSLITDYIITLSSCIHWSWPLHHDLGCLFWPSLHVMTLTYCFDLDYNPWSLWLWLLVLTLTPCRDLDPLFVLFFGCSRMKSLEEDAMKAQAVIARAQEMQHELASSGG